MVKNFDNDVRIVLFVRIKDGVVLDEALAPASRAKIRSGASPRHVPAKIIAVGDIPRTKSGKIAELAVRDIVHGREAKNREALANPEALDCIATSRILGNDVDASSGRSVLSRGIGLLGPSSMTVAGDRARLDDVAILRRWPQHHALR